MSAVRLQSVTYRDETCLNNSTDELNRKKSQGRDIKGAFNVPAFVKLSSHNSLFRIACAT